MPDQGRDVSSDYVLHNQPPDHLIVPFNVTIGYNFSAGRRGFRDRQGPIVSEYPRCPTHKFLLKQDQPELLVNQNPACQCLTARCITADEDSGTFHDAWAATSTVTFLSDFQTFRMGVTPNTQHHAPRIFAPSVLYLPLLQPVTMGSNFTFRAIEAADEDGMTVLEWSTGRGSILHVAKDGRLTMPAVATMDGSNKPWPSGWPDWHKWFTWKARLTATDTATDPSVSTTMTFIARLCTSTQFFYVPIEADNDGISVKAIGQAQTVYVKDWGPSCVHTETRKRMANVPNHTQAECMKVSGTWMGGDYFYTKADSMIECHVDEPCQFEVHAVRLDFVTAGVLSCKWSDATLSAGQKYCHELTKGPEVGVAHDAFHVSYTGEHEHGENFGSNPGKMLIKPFRGRSKYKNPYPFDIGRREVFCVTSMSTDRGNAACPSLPHCVTVLVKGRAPVVTSPVASDTCAPRTRPDASEYLNGECPDLYACWRSETVSEITLSAEDEDIGETVTIVVDSISTYMRYADEVHKVTELAYPRIGGSTNGGVDVNVHCRDRAKDPSLSPATRSIPVDSMAALDGGGGTPPLATVLSWAGHHCGSVIRKVAFEIDFANTSSPLETKVTPLGHRYASMMNDSIICYTVSDNQAEVWGRGVNNKYSRCHVLRMRGAPVFLYSPLHPLDTPFGGQDQYGVGLAETTLTARLSEMVSFTFRARDPNPEDAISVKFLEDPGIPNEAVSRCFVPKYIPRPWACLRACCGPDGIAS